MSAAPQQQQTPVTVAEVDSPIINSPFREPKYHWQIERSTPPVKAEGRRRASYFYRVPEHAGSGRKGRQAELFADTKGEEVELEIVNLIRERVKEWREGTRSSGLAYDGASPITKELLELWRSGDRMQRLFFAQVEAAETVIFLAEAADIYRKGIPEIPKDDPGLESKLSGVRAFVRHACKMATGSGKTTVMGMLAGWSILNSVASPRDDRFSDTILIVCPNVTIRERLQELDPGRGDLSLYRTRQLVPVHRMEDLRRGEVMIANWHRLAKKETNSVNGESAKVVKTGEPVVVVKNAGKANEVVETKYFESDAAWFKRIRRELGSGKGRSLHWLIFNDEAHHAYRRGDTATDEQSLDEDKDLASKNAREATIWIEGLDRINKLAGGSRRRGIHLCVDLSATPFYIQGSGNEVGKPFPWVVSDFGLLDAIESGLVKIPQLPARDVTGAEEAAYFNIWRWVQAKAKEDGYGDSMTPQIVMNYASAPINLLAAEWHQRFLEWDQYSKQQQKHPVPPVFIVVCRDTAVAREVHSWLANGNDGYGVSPPWFRNTPGHEVTVRIDSKVMEDIEAGGTKDETRRLRFILDTIGKSEWLGGKMPEDWSELVRKHNERVASDDDGSLKWIDERIPPGRDVRCIVSVAMLAEGWDANTVTHIVGLRPFGSQLLCEQVVGRALRRKSYAINEDTQMFTEETAKVFGVPFELIPFKVAPAGPQPPQPEPNHIYSVPEKAEYEIRFPIVTGYHQSGSFDVSVDWERVSKVTIDPSRIPHVVELTPLTTPDGSLASYGPGAKPVLSLKDWRALFRDQQVAFRLAREICIRWQADNGATAVPAQQLFPRVAFAAKRFLAEKLECKGDSQPCDVLLVGQYMQASIDALFDAIKKGASTSDAEVAVIPQGASGRGSTLYVDFHTTKPIQAATHCHLNAMVADTQKWEQIAALLLDTHPGVRKWVKNERLGFFIPYRRNGLPARYIPDFIAVTDTDQNVIVEIKGQVTDNADAKAKAAERWTRGVTQLGQHGTWRYLLVTEPGRVGVMLNSFTGAKWDEGEFELN
ncbi:hydrolase [Mesorhizobium sp. B2-3-13]|uniref:BPTD_3080 family restriction endonuclease n=1 Tax=unclassified Mesorhizobium TaxID=325217 RepID=UPI001127B4F0|nr:MULTISPECIES: DEAD/DEAH box helicase family protein [unclassified Mesorhizobium]TPJ90600.1 hydrolase [Mesorhizobium sp. B2-5-13]TPK39130.1 hydrolase [Mesorhizobium sp. B2-5-5]TPL89700.1 hydrolase [Mesorhizobium sp. B2-3-13]